MPTGVETFLEQVRSLRDEDRRALAEARRAGSEVVRGGAWKAAAEMLPERAGAYVSAWATIGASFVPERLEELLLEGADPGVIAEWQDVARLARIAIDEALVALLLSDTILPPHTRELYEPWRRMLEAAHSSRRGG
jgi:hypothetical protein